MFKAIIRFDDGLESLLLPVAIIPCIQC